MAKEIIAMKSSLERAEVKTKLQMTEMIALFNQAVLAEKEAKKDQCQSKLFMKQASTAVRH